MMYQMKNMGTNKVLFTADIYVSPASVFCKQVVYIDTALFSEQVPYSVDEKTSKEDLLFMVADFLEERCYKPISYEYDTYALKVLGLESKKHLFGRMDIASCAVGLLTGFQLDSDNYVGAPVKDELVSFISYDPNLCRKYLLKSGETCI